MTDIPPINGTGKCAGASPLDRVRQAAQSAGPARDRGPVDRVEISETGQALSAAAPDADIRADKVAAIREAIANGTYLTDAKIALAADRMLEALRAS
ncbi:MAG TPA: flagellar biosynthesis anti-sigma factor FlgM, partial [Phycisphaerae bacterium]|nr:flagellar biosynthesis anti-sigma factor FlgM [Phycisphaerae bacterium]